MTTTVKRRSLCLTKETIRQLDDLVDRFGENPSQVMVRALQLLHFHVRFPNLTPSVEIKEAKKCEPV